MEVYMSNNDYLDYLYHARSHKYIDRYLKNGKYVYVYKKNNSGNGNIRFIDKPIRIWRDKPSFNAYKAMNGSINPYNKYKKYERINAYQKQTTKTDKVFAPFTKQVDMLKKKAEARKPIEIKKGTKLTQEQLNTFYRKQTSPWIGQKKGEEMYWLKDEFVSTPKNREIYGKMPSGMVVKKNKKGEYVVK